MNTVINTRSAPGLWVTLRAIYLCAWAQCVDAAHGMGHTTRYLWARYLQARREAAAFERANPVSVWPTGDELAAQLDESALESMAREFGRPGWLSATLLALVISVVLIDLVDGWPTVATLMQGLGTALAALVRG